MSKIFLLRVCAHKKNNDICKISDNKSILFSQLTDAVNTGKDVLGGQLKRLFESEENKERYESFDIFIKEEISYIFEIEEVDLSKMKVWKRVVSGDELEVCHKTIENPLFVLWGYDYHGNLIDRVFCGAYDTERSLSGAVIGSYFGYSFKPGDEKEKAGEKFKTGDIVISNKDGNEGILYVVTYCPDKEFKYFENIYTCSFLQDVSRLTHDHFHEEDISLYTGKVPKAIQWISQLYKGEIKISENDWMKIYDGVYCFSDLTSYEEIKPIE